MAVEAHRAQAALAQCEDMCGLADTVSNMNTSAHQLAAHVDAVRAIVAALPRPGAAAESTVSTTEQLEVLQSLARDHAAIYANAAKLKLITESPEALLANLEAASALRSRRTTAVRLEAAEAEGSAAAAAASSVCAQSAKLPASLPQPERTDRSEPAIIVVRSSVTAYTLTLLHTVQTFVLAEGRQAILAGATRASRDGSKAGGSKTAAAPAHLSLYHTLVSSLYAGSAHSSASSLSSRSTPKHAIPASPTQEQVIAMLGQWCERARSAMLAQAYLNPTSTLKLLSTRASVYSSTLSRLSSLDEAAQAEIALLSTFRRLEALAARVLGRTRASTSGPIADELHKLVHGALSSLRVQLFGQLHGRVEQVFHHELDNFCRDTRLVLETGFGALHGPRSSSASEEIQPETDPLEALFRTPTWLAGQASPQAEPSASQDARTALLQSRSLNEALRTDLVADSRLLRAVVLAISNAASRLGGRVNAWASGLRKVYAQLEGATDSATRSPSASDLDDASMRERNGDEAVTRLCARYTELAHQAAEALLGELATLIAYEPGLGGSFDDGQDEEDGEGRYRREASARCIFLHKVLGALHRRSVLGRILVTSVACQHGPASSGEAKTDQDADADGRRVQDAVDRARGRCLSAWRSVAVDRALGVYRRSLLDLEPTPSRMAEEEATEQDGGGDGTASQEGQSRPGPSTALLAAVQSLTTSVYELGLEDASVFLTTSRQGDGQEGGAMAIVSELADGLETVEGSSRGTTPMDDARRLRAWLSTPPPHDGDSVQDEESRHDDGTTKDGVLGAALGPLLSRRRVER